MAQDSGLRELFLNGAEEDLGTKFPETPWLVVMETGVPGGSYTVVSLHDGTTSIYFSNGGGIIGAGQHPDVAALSQSIVASIDAYRGHFSLVDVATERPEEAHRLLFP